MSWGHKDDLANCIIIQQADPVHLHGGDHSSKVQQERKPQCTNAFKAFACILFVSVPLAKGSHKASTESA